MNASKNGFALVEVLVAVVVMTILAAVLLVVQNNRMSSLESQLAVQGEQLATLEEQVRKLSEQLTVGETLTAQKRAELAYVQNVYKAANAYLAEDVTRTTVPEDCTPSYSVGDYSAGNAPSTLEYCWVTVTNGVATVEYGGLEGGTVP